MTFRDLEDFHDRIREGVKDDAVVRKAWYSVSPDVFRELRESASILSPYPAHPLVHSDDFRLNGVPVREGHYLPAGMVMMLGWGLDGIPTVLGILVGVEEDVMK